MGLLAAIGVGLRHQPRGASNTTTRSDARDSLEAEEPTPAAWGFEYYDGFRQKSQTACAPDTSRVGLRILRRASNEHTHRPNPPTPAAWGFEYYDAGGLRFQSDSPALPTPAAWGFEYYDRRSTSRSQGRSKPTPAAWGFEYYDLPRKLACDLKQPRGASRG